MRLGAHCGWLCGALLALLLAGCGGAADAPSVSSDPRVSSAAPSVVPVLPEVAGMSAEAVRLRTDEAVGGQFQMRLTNTADQPFTVTAVALDSPGFTPVPPREVSVLFPPGRTFDLPVQYGTAQCAAGAAPAGAALTVTRPDGSVQLVQVPLSGNTVGMVFDEQCALARLAAQVTVSLAEVQDVGDGVQATVLLDRVTGDEPVRITVLEGSVLLGVEVLGGLPAELPSGRAQVSVPVVFTATRCDPHAQADAKKPFVFAMSIVVGEQDPVATVLPVDDPTREVLQAYDIRACAGG